MKTPAHKTALHNSKAVANTSSNNQDKRESEVQFEDSRSEVVAQRKLKEMADNSPQAGKIAQLQAIAQGSSPEHVQKQGIEEEGMLQGKFETIQKVAEEEEEIQTKSAAVQKKEDIPTNKNGLPDTLKSGIENLSGLSLDDVKVHYNSAKPAQLQAHAFAQGAEIHMAPGQEKNLPHEAWHVVQQKQGRVKPTKQLKGKVNANDDAGLEKEADVMGAKALSHTTSHGNSHNPSSVQPVDDVLPPVQLSAEARTISGIGGKSVNVDWKGQPLQMQTNGAGELKQQQMPSGGGNGVVQRLLMPSALILKYAGGPRMRSKSYPRLLKMIDDYNDVAREKTEVDQFHLDWMYKYLDPIGNLALKKEESWPVLGAVNADVLYEMAAIQSAKDILNDPEGPDTLKWIQVDQGREGNITEEFEALVAAQSKDSAAILRLEGAAHITYGIVAASLGFAGVTSLVLAPAGLMAGFLGLGQIAIGSMKIARSTDRLNPEQKKEVAALESSIAAACAAVSFGADPAGILKGIKFVITEIGNLLKIGRQYLTDDSLIKAFLVKIESMFPIVLTMVDAKGKVAEIAALLLGSIKQLRGEKLQEESLNS